MYSSEYVIISFGVTLRLLLSRTSGTQVLHSIGTSVSESWESVQEAIALKQDGISAYEGNVVHQAPLAILFWRIISGIFARRIWVVFVILDVATAIFLVNASTKIYKTMCKREAKRSPEEICNESRQKLGLREDKWKSVRLMVLSWYMMNPYTLIACASQSTVVLSNFFLLQLMMSITDGNHKKSAGLVAIVTYLNYYPIGFLFVVLSQNYKDTRKALEILVIFSGILIGLLFGSYLLEDGSWAFFDSVYVFLLTIPDYTPHMSLFWYMFAEMFEHFRDFFVAVFLVTTTFVPLPLSVRINNHPTFLCLVVWLTICIFRPYPAIGELGIIISLFPIWRHLFSYMRVTLLTVCACAVVLVLGPLMHYLWLFAGSANANFYFAISMLHSITQIYLLSHILSAFFKNEFLLKHGPKPKLKDGSDVRTRLE